MNAHQIFPFEYVDRGSKVIVYGLGKYGTSFIEQVEATKWCRIVGVSDKNVEKDNRSYSFIEADKLGDVDADYIIIAIADIETVSRVYNYLIKSGIPDSKIISTLMRSHVDYKHLTEDEKVNENKPIQILIQLGGGLGDCVVYLSAYKKIEELLQQGIIDIKCNKEYGEALYTGKRLVRSIIDNSEGISLAMYDLCLMLEHGIHIIKYDEIRCSKLACKLNEKIQLLMKTSRYVGNDVSNQLAIQPRVAILRGWNRYFALGHGEVLGLRADMVHVELSTDYESEYRNLRLKKYITLNRGADKWAKYKTMQTKVWPLKFYEQLITMLKKKYAEYEIVQIGSNDTEEIRGVDRYIKGQSLELIKYILKNSSLHFDCEGGLVHLATALGTKCVVVFGPTPVEYYGYPQNINITAGKCSNCMHLLRDWYVECLKGQQEPECMYGITPIMVYEKIKDYLCELSKEEAC